VPSHTHIYTHKKNINTHVHNACNIIECFDCYYCVLIVLLSEVRKGVHVLWIDNFSKTMARSIPTEQRGTYTPALWTGIAAFKGNTQDLDDSVVIDHDGDVVSAMPNCLLQYKDSVMTGVEFISHQGMFYNDVSLINQYDVRTVPPKVDTRMYPEMKQVIDSGANSLQNVCPVTLSPENIGSNRGLIAVIRELYDEYNMGEETCERYLTLNVDENIFWRILKVFLHIILCFSMRCVYNSSIYIGMLCALDDVRFLWCRNEASSVHWCIPCMVAQFQMVYKNDNASVCQ